MTLSVKMKGKGVDHVRCLFLCHWNNLFSGLRNNKNPIFRILDVNLSPENILTLVVEETLRVTLIRSSWEKVLRLFY